MATTVKITFTRDGYYFSAQVTTDTLATFLSHIHDVTAALDEAGCQPARYGNDDSAPPAHKPAAGDPTASTGPAPICPIHGKAMKESKFGGWYCTSRLEDGSYCKQKIKAAA